MRLRLLFLLAAALIVLAFPAGSLAVSRWAVKDNSGHTRGTFVKQGYAVGYCINRAGKNVGDLSSGSGDPGGIVGVPPSSQHPYGWSVGAVQWGKFHTMTANRIVGLAVRDGDRWALKRLVNGKWQKHGSMVGTCPSYFAVTALRLLLWN